MKSYLLFFILLLPVFANGQIIEAFSDGSVTEKSEWTGTWSNFTINSSGHLQSAADESSTSYLFTASEITENASWKCTFKFHYPTSASNYACMYIISDTDCFNNALKGYFVQLGGKNDEVSLYRQAGNEKIKIIDGIDKRTDGKDIEIAIMVTRDSNSVFCLYSRLIGEKEYVLEGRIQDVNAFPCYFFGLTFTNTSSTGHCYVFDDVFVTGDRYVDVISPTWLSMNVKLPNTINMSFSEPMDVSAMVLMINGSITEPLNFVTSNNGKNFQIDLPHNFHEKTMYNIQLCGLTDRSGNKLTENRREYAIPEPICPGDVVFNEVMFNPSDSAFEYIEFYNRSDKVIDVSGLSFTNRKSDGTMNAGKKIPDGVMLLPQKYLAITSNPQVLKTFHRCADTAHIIKCEWFALHNASAFLVLTNSNQDTIYDEFYYESSMHHVLIKNPKGVSLERISPSLSSMDRDNWHSCAFTHNYGTPGFENSQFREFDKIKEQDDLVFCLTNTIFSPDNDGVDDVCVIQYQLPSNGYVANMLILSPTGERICTLLNNQVLASSGNIVWDGQSTDGRIANVGIYVVYINILHPGIGERKVLKLPLVLSSR